MAEAGRLDEAHAHCGKLVRESDPDRYYAALFAPATERPHLLALYAFSGEIARVRETISGPMPGEIRLQWWRDALAGEARGSVADHPVAAAILDTVERYHLPGRPCWT
jgi:phytoene synthase